METDGISIAHLESSLLQVRSLLFFHFQNSFRENTFFFPLNRENREKNKENNKEKIK